MSVRHNCLQSYDTLNRISQVSYNTVSGVTTAPTVTYTYDTDPTYGTSAQGAVVRVNVGTDYQERYTFDTYKRVSSAIRTIGTRSYTTSYQYNAAGQPLQAGNVAYQYDSAGRLSALADPSGGNVYMNNLTYNIAGQVTGDRLYTIAALPDALTDESFAYDANRQQLTSQTATRGGTTLMNLTYNYSASAGQMGVGSTAGNANQLMSVSGTINGATESANYTYDNYDRLATSNQTSNSTSTQRRFAYDRWGNRTVVWDATSGGNSIQTVTTDQGINTPPSNRIVSVTNGKAGTLNYTYDAAGNITNDGVHSYTYDSESRQVSLDSGAASYAYDQQNQRYKKTVGSTVTHYVWEGGKVQSEYNGSTGAVQMQYYYAGSRLFMTIGSGSGQYYLSDRLSVRLTLGVVNFHYVVTGQQAHLPFGEDFAESGTQQKQHFTSYERDSESGTDYALNRQYTSSAGRFMTVDPIFDAGFKTTSSFARSSTKKTIQDILRSPQDLNRYTYGMEDPVGNTDPTGLGWRKVLYCTLKLAELIAGILAYYNSMAALIGACGETAGLGCVLAFIWSRVALVFLADVAIDAYKTCKPELPPGVTPPGGDGGGGDRGGIGGRPPGGGVGNGGGLGCGGLGCLAWGGVPVVSGGGTVTSTLDGLRLMDED